MKFNQSTRSSQQVIHTVTNDRELAAFLRVAGESVPDIDNPKFDFLGSYHSFKFHLNQGFDSANFDNGEFTEENRNQHLLGFEQCDDDGVSRFRFATIVNPNGEGHRLLRYDAVAPVYEKLVGSDWVRPEGAPQDEYSPLPRNEDILLSCTRKEWEEYVRADLAKRGMPDWAINTIEIVNRKDLLGEPDMFGYRPILWPIRNIFLAEGKTYHFKRDQGWGFRFVNRDGSTYQNRFLNPDSIFEVDAELEDVEDDPDFVWAGKKKNEKPKVIKYANEKNKEANIFRPRACREYIECVIAREKAKALDVGTRNLAADVSILEEALTRDLSDRKLDNIFQKWANTSGVQKVITEGGFKTLAFMAEGMVTGGLPGINMGCKKESTELRPELVEFLGNDPKNVAIAFDQDPIEKIDTVRNVSIAQKKLEKNIQEHYKKLGKFVYFEALVWPRGAGKGGDDVLNNGNGNQIMSLGIIDQARLTGAKAINMRYLGKDVFANCAGKINAMCSPMGTGKSVALAAHINEVKKQKENVRVVAFAHRIALAGESAHKFGVKKVEEGEYNQSDGALCVDSVYKMTLGGNVLDVDLNEYRVTVTDEFVSVMDHMYNGGTFTSDRTGRIKRYYRGQVQTMLNGEIHLLDASVNDLVLGIYKKDLHVVLLEMIHECEAAIARFDDRIEHAKVLLTRLQEIYDNFENVFEKTINVASEKPKPVVAFHHDKSPLVYFDQMFADYANGDTICCLVTASNKKAKYAPKKLAMKAKKVRPKGKVLIVCAENFNDPQHHLFGALQDGRFLEIMQQYDLVLIDASVDSGIDINIPDHFDSYYVFAFQGNPNNIYQAMGRVRCDNVKRYLWCASHVAYNPDQTLPQDFDDYEFIAKKELQYFKKQLGTDVFSSALYESCKLMRAQANKVKQYFPEAIAYLASRQYELDSPVELLVEYAEDKDKKKSLGKLAKDFTKIKVEFLKEHNERVYDAPDKDSEEVVELLKDVGCQDFSEPLPALIQHVGRTEQVRDILERNEVLEVYGKAGLRHVEAHTMELHKKIMPFARAMQPDVLGKAMAQKDLEDIEGGDFNAFDVVGISKSNEVNLLSCQEFRDLWTAAKHDEKLRVLDPVVVSAFYALKKIYKSLNTLPGKKYKFQDAWFAYGEEKMLIALNHLLGVNHMKLEFTGQKVGGKNGVGQEMTYYLCVKEGKDIVYKDGIERLITKYVPLNQSAVLDAINVMVATATCLAGAYGLNEAEKMLQEQMSESRGMSVAG